MDQINKSIFSIKSKTQVVLSKKTKQPYVFMVLTETTILGIEAKIIVFNIELSEPRSYKCSFSDQSSFKDFYYKLFSKFEKFDIDIFKYDGIFSKDIENRYEEWKSY